MQCGEYMRLGSKYTIKYENDKLATLIRFIAICAVFEAIFVLLECRPKVCQCDKLYIKENIVT